MEQTLQFIMAKKTLGSTEIELNPWEVIPLKNSKQATSTTEVHLGKRNGTILTNFQSFCNLQILWINDNQITSLHGLQSNFRIKHLFAQHNRIRQLDGIFDRLKHVETLVLYENQLRDLSAILKQLQILTSLRHLELFGNPAAHEPNYKHRVLNELPWLEILDRHKLSQQQKDAAVKFMSQSGKKGKSKWV